MKKELVIKLSNGAVLELDDINMRTFYYYIPSTLCNRISMDTIRSMQNPLRSEILDACKKLLEPKADPEWWRKELERNGDRGQVNNDAEWYASLCDELDSYKEDE